MFGSIVTVSTGYGYLRLSTNEELSFDKYEISIFITLIGILLELLGEPIAILIQIRLLFHVRAIIELTALFAKCITIYVLVMYSDMQLEAFAWSQVAYGVTCTLCHVLYFLSKQLGGHPLPSCMPTAHVPTWSELLHLGTLYWQAGQRTLLAEGEKFVLRSVASIEDQSPMTVASVLGSLFVRVCFAPLEEGLAPIFSKFTADDPAIRVGGIQVLRSVVTTLSYVGTVVAAIGPAFTFVGLHLLYHGKYDDTPAAHILAVYCVYVYFLGVNGTTEAFVHAVSPVSTLATLNLLMLPQWLLVMALSYTLLGWKWPAALVIANTVGVAVRLAVNWFYLRRYSTTLGVSAPQVIRWPALAMAVAVVVWTQCSQAYLCSVDTGFTWGRCGLHLVSGAVAAAAFAGLM